MSSAFSLIPAAFLLIALFSLLATGVSRVRPKDLRVTLSSALLMLLVPCLLSPGVPLPILAASITAACLLGVALASRDAFQKVIHTLLFPVLLLLAFGQLYAHVATCRYAQLSQFFDPDLICFRFTEIVAGGFVVASLFGVVSFVTLAYFCRVARHSLRDTAHRERRDRAMVNAPIGHRERSAATLAVG
jgi:hypothetical protein